MVNQNYSGSNINLIDTEEYVQNLIEEQNAWNDQYEKQLDSILLDINRFLSLNNSDRIDQLLSYLDKNEIAQHYKSIPEIAYILVLCSVYQGEIECNESTHIFDGINSITSAIEHFNSIKFSLINVEWDFSRNNELLFITEQIQLNYLSLTALTFFIQLSNINKNLVCDLIIDNFINQRMVREAAQITVNKTKLNNN